MPVNMTKQAVTHGTLGEPLVALLGDAEAALAAWYADPLPRGTARLLHEMARRERQARLCRGESCFHLELLQLVCCYWLDSGAGLAYRQLVSLAHDAAGQALLELVYGQLLISRKLHAAHSHLEHGFALAAQGLESVDYITLVRRHEQLAWLPLGDAPATPAPLAVLLREAAVIARLTGGRRIPPVHAHHDTVG